MSDVGNAVNTSEPSDWRYLSEGGASIVFAYVGPTNSTLSNKVLRLRKSPRTSASSLSSVYEESEPEIEDPSVAFQRTVTARLVAPTFLPDLHPIPVSSEWLADLARLAEPHRPPERRAVDQIDLRRKTAVLATDLVGHDGLAVEIKPKWGFLPRPTHLSPHTRARKTHHCRFCMHAQYLSRASKHKVSDADAVTGSAKAEGFCPLDLYSGEEGRVRRALRALWDAWVASGGRVNNLKLFVNGHRLDPNEEKDMHLLLKALSLPSDSDVKLAFITALLPTLLDTPILRHLAHLQRTLDPLDVEGLFALHLLARGETEKDKPLEELFPEPDLSKWEDFVSVFKKANPDPHFESLPEVGSDNRNQGQEEQEWEPTFNPENLYYFTLAYLLSATFKDCSVMLRPSLLSPRGQCAAGDEKEENPSESKQRTRAGSITVIDLDPKSIRRLKKWYELDRTLVDAFEEPEIEDGKKQGVCVDAFTTMHHH